MPYIKAINSENGYEVRRGLQNGERALNAGELNYQIFYYVKHNIMFNRNSYLRDIGMFVSNFLGEKPNYQKYNDMTGALVRCHIELQRRLEQEHPACDILFDILESYDQEIADYEDLKIKENGDVE